MATEPLTSRRSLLLAAVATAAAMTACSERSREDRQVRTALASVRSVGVVASPLPPPSGQWIRTSTVAQGAALGAGVGLAGLLGGGGGGGGGFDGLVLGVILAPVFMAGGAVYGAATAAPEYAAVAPDPGLLALLPDPAAMVRRVAEAVVGASTAAPYDVRIAPEESSKDMDAFAREGLDAVAVVTLRRLGFYARKEMPDERGLLLSASATLGVPVGSGLRTEDVGQATYEGESRPLAAWRAGATGLDDELARAVKALAGDIAMALAQAMARHRPGAGTPLRSQ